MASAEETEPIKRRPGRPKKAATPAAAAAEDPAPDAWRNIDGDEVDRERIGLPVDPTTTDIGYSDGRGYRCEGGKIVARVR